MAQLLGAQKGFTKINTTTVRVQLQQLYIYFLAAFPPSNELHQISNVLKKRKVEQLSTKRGLLTKEWTFLFSSSVRSQLLPPSFLIIINLFIPRYLNNMKNNRTIRRVKCIRPAARLVNSGPTTTQSLSFSVHLIQLPSSFRPATRLVNSGLNRSQLSSIMRT